MEIGDIMNRTAIYGRPDATLREAAGWMRVFGLSSLPVCFYGRLIGRLTEALVIQFAARRSTVLVRDVMETEVHFCFEDQEIVDVSQSMIDERIDQLPVLDADLQFVGNVSLEKLMSALNRSPAHELWAASRRTPLFWQRLLRGAGHNARTAT